MAGVTSSILSVVEVVKKHTLILQPLYGGILTFKLSGVHDVVHFCGISYLK